MWTHVIHVIDNKALTLSLHNLIEREPWLVNVESLVQVYLSPEYAPFIVENIENCLPKATIVGSSAYGTLQSVESRADTIEVTSTGISLSVMVFEHCHFVVKGLNIQPHEEYDKAKHFTASVLESLSDVQGVLLLLPIREFNNEKVVSGVVDAAGDIPVFGGIAADQNELDTTLVFSNKVSGWDAATFVFLCGKQLAIVSHSYLGWVPFGEQFKVTQANDLRVVTINDQPAYRLYQDYTGIERDNFYRNALDFPFIVNRDGKYIARVPSRIVGDDLVCTGNINEGDELQFSYGNPDTIFSKDCYAEPFFKAFQPDSIMVFSCCIRMALLEEQKVSEVSPYEDIAPVLGTFTFGEIDSNNYGGNILNATLVTVGIKEFSSPDVIPDLSYLNGYKHFTAKADNRLERLMNMVSRMTGKLYQANIQLNELAQLDPLTKALNRRAFHEKSQRCVFNKSFSLGDCSCKLILFDVDNFKQINDKYGHLIGDQALIKIVKICKRELSNDLSISRYGGEEFAIILPSYSIEHTREIAERLRACIESESEDRDAGIPNFTCSFGIASLEASDTIDNLIHRADQKLYIAKAQGKNCVVG